MTRAEPFAIHFNARIRGLKSRLFSRDRLEDILDQHDLNVTIELLLQSPYRAEMAEALAIHQGADAVEHAVTSNMIVTFQRMVYRAEGRFRELASLFLLRWDLSAVKSLLRVRHTVARGGPATDALYSGATLPLPLIRDLAGRDSMSRLVSGLTGWQPHLGVALSEVLPIYTREQDLAVLEDAVDRTYFVQEVRNLAGDRDENAQYLRRILRMEIDRINLRLLFLLLEAKASPAHIEARLLPEGGMPSRVLRRMAAAKGVVELMELLGGTPYRELVEIMFQFLQRRRFSPIERYFETMLMKELRRMACAHPLSIAVLMDYVWRKYNEVTNLRLIARGEARHLPRGLVREEILYA